MDKKALLLVWLLLGHLGNFADLALTLYAVANGAVEVNPLMAWLLSVSPFLFGVVKVVLFSFAIDIIARKYPALLKPIAIGYMLVVAWHLSFVFLL